MLLNNQAKEYLQTVGSARNSGTENGEDHWTTNLPVWLQVEQMEHLVMWFFAPLSKHSRPSVLCAPTLQTRLASNGKPLCAAWFNWGPIVPYLCPLFLHSPLCLPVVSPALYACPLFLHCPLCLSSVSPEFSMFVHRFSIVLCVCPLFRQSPLCLSIVSRQSSMFVRCFSIVLYHCPLFLHCPLRLSIVSP